jgi:hypothetical protein
MARLNVELSGRTLDLLDGLSDKYGKSKAEMLRIALALFFVAEKEESQGKSLSISKDGKIEKELVLVK